MNTPIAFVARSRDSSDVKSRRGEGAGLSGIRRLTAVCGAGAGAATLGEEARGGDRRSTGADGVGTPDGVGDGVGASTTGAAASTGGTRTTGVGAVGGAEEVSEEVSGEDGTGAMVGAVNTTGGGTDTIGGGVAAPGEVGAGRAQPIPSERTNKILVTAAILMSSLPSGRSLGVGYAPVYLVGTGSHGSGQLATLG